jgi:hypothetical protein
MKIAGAIANIQTIAKGHGIRELGLLRQSYGEGNWKKKKGWSTRVVILTCAECAF